MPGSFLLLTIWKAANAGPLPGISTDMRVGAAFNSLGSAPGFVDS